MERRAMRRKGILTFLQHFLRCRRGEEDFFILLRVDLSHGKNLATATYTHGVIYESINNLRVKNAWGDENCTKFPHAYFSVSTRARKKSINRKILELLSCLLSCSCCFVHIIQRYFRSIEQCTSRHFFIPKCLHYAVYFNIVPF